MATVLITGANRGIGLELARQYAAAGWDVIACCRKPKEAGDLKALTGKVEVKTLDVAKPASIAKLTAALKWRGIDVLLNNAGILGRRVGFGKAETKEFLAVMQVNALGPLLMAESFWPLVKKSKQKKMVAITSGMGSIASGANGGSYAYRSSKAALNMVMKNLGNDLSAKGILTAAISPGWVKTDMGGKSAPLAVQDSAAGIIQVIGGLDAAKSGGFFNYNGDTIPW
ncbi:SDR family oxidoreductase [Dongia sp.]|uniref:SDR family oxidoreductase n=1 Tax=Dongia sp. TaxID=1977262 RepID=UPI0035B225EF